MSKPNRAFARARAAKSSVADEFMTTVETVAEAKAQEWRAMGRKVRVTTFQSGPKRNFATGARPTKNWAVRSYE
jgi:hypothetical protein